MAVSAQDASYALGIVKTICEEIGPGLPGSDQEWGRAAVFRKELESHLGAGRVVVEEFTMAPWACVGAMPVSAAFIAIAALLNLAAGRSTTAEIGTVPVAVAVASLAFSLAAILVYVLEFILGFELIDRWFQQKRSVNVIGTLRAPGTGHVKRLLMVSGHHDSAPENTWLALLGYGMLMASAAALLGFLVMLAMSAIQVIGVFTASARTIRFGTVGWGILIFPIIPSVIYGLFFNRGRKNGGTVPGAVDNLAGSALVVAVCRFLVRNPSYIPADTEIRFLSFGSEEAGLRGSRRYVARHLDELRRLDARLVNFEMVAHPEIGVLTSDAHGTVKHSPEIVDSVVAAGERAQVPYKVKSAYLGVATDAAPFSKAGLAATTLLPFRAPQQMVAFYHQKSDRPEALNPKALLNVLKLACEWIREGGGKGAT